jgi:DNA polymerase I-like protein with 3'-5' exonuclease and polymerase domains
LIRSRDRALVSQAERQAINSPVQSTLTDMMIWTLAILNERYPELMAFLMIHDAAYFYVPEDEVELWAGRIKEVGENLPFDQMGWTPQLTFPMDAEWGPTLADA